MEAPALNAVGREIWSGDPFGESGFLEALVEPAPQSMPAPRHAKRARLARWLVACSNACRGVPLDVLERVADRRERKPDLADALAAMFEGFGSKE